MEVPKAAVRCHVVTVLKNASQILRSRTCRQQMTLRAIRATIEPHTVCFLASGLVITKLVDGTGYLVCMLHAGAVLLKKSFWLSPISAYTYMR